MPIGRRDKLVAAFAVAAFAAVLAHHAAERRPADPCDAQPAAYACAVFAQPEWLTRRVHAGRMQGQPAIARAPTALVGVEAVAVEGDPPPVENHRDGV